MSDDRAREYAEWYVWAKRNVSSTPEISHAAAQAAAEAKRSGGDPQAAARNAAQSRSGPGWARPETAAVRQYAEWYDWTRVELGATGDDLARATTAAVAALRDGGDSTAAVNAARAAVGRTDAGPPGVLPSATPAPPPPPLPAPAPSEALPPTAAPAPGPAPLPPPPPYPPVAPSTWSPAAYPADPVAPAPGYGYPGSGGTDGYAIASLVCSLVALPAIFCYGLPAIILGAVGFFLGRSALKRIRASGGVKGGHGLAMAGWIVGLVAAVIGLLVGIILVGALALVATGVIPVPTPSP